jgi:hypothetical protein
MLKICNYIFNMSRLRSVGLNLGIRWSIKNKKVIEKEARRRLREMHREDRGS